MECHSDLSRYREMVIEKLAGLVWDFPARQPLMIRSPFTASHRELSIKYVTRRMLIGVPAQPRPAAVGENHPVVRLP
jgi:hypothetical protein